MALATIRATGQLAAAAAVLYTAVADCFVFVSLANTDSVARAVALYLNTGTRRRFLNTSLPVAPSALSRPYGPIYMKSGDTIDGDAAAANVVDFVVSGASL